jgi:pimeloyl-ACP methyl ester carboxylesterase
VVGHSLGGGVAMQFAYQFPHLCERLVLVSTGGVGREVHPVLRLAALPQAAAGLGLLTLPAARTVARLGVALLRRLDTDLGVDADDLLRVFDALPDALSREAVVRTLRAVVDTRGQVVTMLDRCYLTRAMPTLLVWGDRDPVIPVEHARMAHTAMPGSRLEVLRGVGHFPHHGDAAGFAAVLLDFLAGTEPAAYDREAWRELLRRGRPASSAGAPAAITEQAISSAPRSAT